MKLIYLYLFTSAHFCVLPPLPSLITLEVCAFKGQDSGIRYTRTQKMDQADILRKFIQGVRTMSQGDDERGEDNFGSDFMVGLLLLCQYHTLHFHLSSISHPSSPSPGSLHPPGGEAGAATLPSSFSSHLQAVHGGLALSPHWLLPLCIKQDAASG